MLKSDDFPPQNLKPLTEQINRWLGDMIGSGQLEMDRVMDSGLPMTMDSFELGENFLMAFMDDDEIRDPKSLGRDLAELVKPTGRRHHQLKNRKKAFGYARSFVPKPKDDKDPKDDKPETETLCQLFATRLAPNIQAAIEWLDNNEDKFANGTWRVRLITIPTFHTHAFLIQQLKNGSDVTTGESQILVVSRPEWMEDTLPLEKPLKTKEFLKAFESKSPIIGVSGDADIRERPRR